MAGVLELLPALLAITTPTTLSFERLIPNKFAGSHQCWGVENKEAPLRLVTMHHTRASQPAECTASSLSRFCSDTEIPARMEFKALDGTANLFLAVGVIVAAGAASQARFRVVLALCDLAACVGPILCTSQLRFAGLHGLQTAKKLPSPVNGRPSDARESSDKVPSMPKSLQEAVQHLEKSPVLLAALGTELTSLICAHRHADVELAKLSFPHGVYMPGSRYLHTIVQRF
jgi:glutamine synthetase